MNILSFENWPSWIQDVSDYFANHEKLQLAIDAVFTFTLISFIVFIALKFRKALTLIVFGAVLGLILAISVVCGLSITNSLYSYAIASYLVVCIVILAPEIRRTMELNRNDNSQKTLSVAAQNQKTINSIVEAVFNMSAEKVGALITIEQHIDLNQYAERAITLNSDISRELLEQIFIKDSPLHDGGVIIRGNKIVCAGAYYSLTQNSTLDKTVGSRHRAGMGISELTDSLTIIVSEETGFVETVNQGFMKRVFDKSELIGWLNDFLANTV